MKTSTEIVSGSEDALSQPATSLPSETVDDEDPILTREPKLMAEDTDGGRSLSNILFSAWYTRLHKFTVLLNLILLLSFLFVEEYTQDNDSRILAESIIFWCGLMAPQVLLFIPIQVSFYASFSRKTRFRLLQLKPFLIEILMLLGLVTAIPLVLALHNLKAKDIIKETSTVFAIFSSLLSMTTIEDKKQLCMILHHAKTSQPLFRVHDILHYLRSKAQDSNVWKQQEAEIVEMTNNPCSKCQQSCHTNFCCNHTFECISKLPSVRENMALNPKNFEVRMDDTSTTKLYDLVDQHLSATSMLGNSPAAALSVILKLLLKFPSKLVTFAITSILSQIAIALLPYSTALVVDAISRFNPASASNQQEILIPAAILFGNLLLIPIFDSSALLIGVRLGANVQKELKYNLCQVVLGIQTPTRNNKRVGLDLSPGDLSSRFANDVAVIGDFISGSLYYDFSAGAVRTIVSLIILGLFDARTAIFFAICIPVLISVQGGNGRTKSNSTKASGNVQGAFQNIVKVRRTNALYDSGVFVWDTVSPRMDQDIQVLEEGAVGQAVFAASVNGYTNLYIGLISVAFILSIVQRAEDGDGDDLVLAASLGLGLIGTIFSPVKALARAGQKWLQCIPALHRIRETDIISGTTEPSMITDDDEVPLLNESLVLEDVRFQYPTADEETLKGVNLNLKAGEYVCIVGESGAGKSTLLNILTQEETTTKGQVLIDVHPVESARSYQRQIGVVLQDSNFLEGTIRDNIRMGKPDATEEEIDRAVTKSQCSRFVNDLPNGIDTFLGPNLNVSGGQAQRISLARALVRSPRVLILDEATSALDLSTEREVIDTISHLAHDDNVLVISVTHRLETTDLSNRIVVLENGKVAEEGSPRDLNQSGTLFERIRNGGEEESDRKD